MEPTDMLIWLYCLTLLTLFCLQNASHLKDLDGRKLQSASTNRSPSCRCNQTEERISCFNCDSNTLFREIEKLNKSHLFNDVEITNILFPDGAIPASWLKNKITIGTLSIKDDVISAIEPNAFNASTFNHLFKLKLQMPLEILRNGTFNGLTMFKLELRNIKLHTVETGVLRDDDKFHSLYIGQSQLHEGAIRNLLISVPVKTYYIYFERNKLLTKISKDLFSKFTAIDGLNLPSNGITYIEAGSFDSFAEKLRTLTLDGNLLRTLSEGVLPHRFFLSNHTKYKRIVLNNNPWHCSYQLKGLQKTILEYRTFIIVQPRCATPIHLKGKEIIEVGLCANENDCLSNKCNVIPSSILKSIKFLNGWNNDLLLRLKTVFGTYNLVWFTKVYKGIRSAEPVKCIALRGNVLAKINFMRKLETNEIYTFCLMGKDEIMVYPNHCATWYTYQKQDQQTVWLDQDMKILVVASFLVSCGLAFLTGICITIVSKNRTLAKEKERIGVDGGNNPRMSTLSNFYIPKNDQGSAPVPPPRNVRFSNCSVNSKPSSVDDVPDELVSNDYVEI